MGMKPDIEAQLRQAVLDAGISRYQLADLSGVTEGQLSRFVRRERTLTLPAAAKVAVVLGLELRPAKRQQKGR